MKKYLAAQDPAETKKQLVGQLNRFTRYYNTERPHRGLGRRTPITAFEAREKAGPIGPRIEAAGYRIRHDKVRPFRFGDAAPQGQAPSHRGGLPLRGVAGHHARRRPRHQDLGHRRFAPTTPHARYEHGLPADPLKGRAGVYDVLKQLSPMSRDITFAAPTGFEPVSPP